MFFRATYRPRGNGIVKRHHGTVRATAERSHISPMEVVFWYNISLKTRSISAPQRTVFKYEWLYPQATSMSTASEEQSSMQIGEEVWIKPLAFRCDNQWGRAISLQILSMLIVSPDISWKCVRVIKWWIQWWRLIITKLRPCVDHSDKGFHSVGWMIIRLVSDQ